MSPFAAEIHEALEFVRRLWNCRPKVGIILGTGLGRFVDQMMVEQTIPYERLPHFSPSTADGHEGQLVCGRLNGVEVMTMAGRCHAYEGHSPAKITMPVRLMRALGVELLILSNASGGMNPGYRSGDVMVVEDHIDLMGQRCSVETRDFEGSFSGPKSRSYYCPQLIELALASARCGGFVAHRGVYAAMMGPNYETRAEYRMLRAMGADAVGMSTVPEALVAAHCGMRVLALSTITNICLPDRLTPARHEDVLAAAASAEPKVRRIVLDVVAPLAKPPICNERPVRRLAQVDGATLINANGTPQNGMPGEALAEHLKPTNGR